MHSSWSSPPQQWVSEYFLKAARRVGRKQLYRLCARHFNYTNEYSTVAYMSRIVLYVCNDGMDYNIRNANQQSTAANILLSCNLLRVLRSNSTACKQCKHTQSSVLQHDTMNASSGMARTCMHAIAWLCLPMTIISFCYCATTINTHTYYRMCSFSTADMYRS